MTETTGAALGGLSRLQAIGLDGRKAGGRTKRRTGAYGEDIDASGFWPAKAVTTIEPAGPFWEAEPEHQDYLVKYPNGYTCHFPRKDWVLPRRDATTL